MKRVFHKSIFILIISIGIYSCHCKKGSGNIIHDKRDVPAFTKIRLTGSHQVFITQDSVQKLEVVADDNIAPIIKTDVSGGTLEIGLKSGECIRKAHQCDIYIHVPSLTSVTLDGSGIIKNENTFKGGNMDLLIKGSGTLQFNFKGDQLYSRIDGSGFIDVNGSANNALLSIDGSGNIDASGVQAEYATTSISGSGLISVNVNKHIDARIKGSGSVNYSGDATASPNVSGSGQVVKK